jgi:hypothetical protein
MAAAAQEPARGLHVVGGTGEIVEHRETALLLAEVEKLKTDLKAAERDLRAKRRRITELERDRVKERETYRRRADVERVHSYWQRRLGHAKALTADRFDAVQGMLDQVRIDVVDGKRVKAPAYSLDDFKAAIDGAWFDPFITRRKNGTEQRHDDLALICRDAKTFDGFVARAPRA